MRELIVTEGRPAAEKRMTMRLGRENQYAGHLALVNSRHPVRSAEPELVDVTPFGVRQASSPEEPRIRLERTCLQRLSALLTACGGRETIAVVSGYRSRETQAKLYADSVRENGEAFTARYVALPGASEHQTGLAVDVGLYRPGIDYVTPSFPDEGVCAEFRRLAAKFGFIRRYSADKTDKTGIADEPWHYRYVGYPHSELMDREGLCLEEYTEFVRRHAFGTRHLYAEDGTGTYEIYGVPAEEDFAEVPVPGAGEAGWRLSGNNAGGFVVTAFYPAAAGRAAHG